MRGRRQRRCDLEGRSSGSSPASLVGGWLMKMKSKKEMAQRRCEGGQERGEWRGGPHHWSASFRVAC